MTQVFSNPGLEDSRLVRFLLQIGQPQPAIKGVNFADKLGRLIDFADAFELADMLRHLEDVPLSTRSMPASELMAELLETRAALVANIIKGFAPDEASLAFHLPVPQPDKMLKGTEGIEAYQRFYAIHQSEMDFEIQKLRVMVRDMAAGCSAEMAMLVRLDAGLADTLASPIRKIYTVLSRLLARRFDVLRQQYLATNPVLDDVDTTSWTKSGGWLDQFHRELQGLLLAELDCRLQPVLGLIEALDQEERIQ